MPNVFADTHDPPPQPPARPAPGFGINQGRQLLSDLRTATGARLDALAQIAGLRRSAVIRETDGELRARLIDVYADHLQTRLDASRALVARVRAAIGARPSESTDAALSRLVEAPAALRAVKRAVGLPLTTPASEIPGFFRRFEADIERAIAPTRRGEFETLGEAIERSQTDTSRDNVRLSGIVRGVRAALGAAEGVDLVSAAVDLRETVNRFRDALCLPENATVGDIAAGLVRYTRGVRIAAVRDIATGLNQAAVTLEKA